VCQLECPLCPNTKNKIKNGIIGWGHLKFSDFKQFVDKNPQILKIELSNWGEIFLNPELKEIIKYAYSRKINLVAKNGVNFNNVSEEMLECLVKYGFKVIDISLDGTNDNSYQKYRKRGNFSKVINNIEKINYYKKKYKTEFPSLTWKMILFGHNEDEVHIAKRMAHNLNMHFITVSNFHPLWSPLKVNEEKIDNRDKKDKKPVSLAPCSQLWQSPQINWDGKLLGCCSNIWGDFGNVFKEGFEECLNGEKYIYGKMMVMGKKEPRSDIPCSDCHHYLRDIIKNPIKNEDLL
jgi:MoaA/NifB/PqqE/SkfB family radical SAM enzyme